MHIRLDDNVEVMAGADKGTRGRVLKILKQKRRVVVEGINRVRKHVQKSQKNPQGGQLSKEMPVDVSNIMFVCPHTSQPTRIGYYFDHEGAKHRYSRRQARELIAKGMDPAEAKTQAVIDEVSPPKKSYAGGKA